MNPHSSSNNDTSQLAVVAVSVSPSTEIKELKHEQSAPDAATSEESLLKGKEISQSESESESDDDLSSAATGPSSEKASRTADDEVSGTGLNLIEEVAGRERIKRHRVEVAGRVWIPEIWGQEDLLKDWTDCSGFEASLMNSTIMSARAALIEEGRRANSTSLRMEGSC